MTRGTVFNAGHDYPNVEAFPGLSPADARIEMLFIESAQVGVVACELARLPLGLGAARRRGFGPAIDPLGRGLDFLLNMPRWIVRPSRLLSPSPRKCPEPLVQHRRRVHSSWFHNLRMDQSGGGNHVKGIFVSFGSEGRTLGAE